VFEAGSSILGLFFRTGEKIIINPIVKTVDVITDTVIPETAMIIVDRLKYELGTTPPPPPSTMEIIRNTLSDIGMTVANFMEPFYEIILNYAKMVASYAESGTKIVSEYLPSSLTENYSPLTLAIIAIFGSIVAFKVGSKLLKWLSGNLAYIYEHIELAINELKHIHNDWLNTEIDNKNIEKRFIIANKHINSAIKLIDKVENKMKIVNV
jgi:hypothetical protein